MITIHFIWIFCLMILSIASIGYIVYDKKNCNQHEREQEAIISGMRQEMNVLRRTNSEKSHRILELEQKQELHIQSPDDLSGQIIELQKENRELGYKWIVMRNWAVLLQKKYYGESEQGQGIIEQRLADCNFKIVHYDAKMASYFSTQSLKRRPGEPEAKETQPALVFINDGNAELINKGVYIQFT